MTSNFGKGCEEITRQHMPTQCSRGKGQQFEIKSQPDWQVIYGGVNLSDMVPSPSTN